MLNQLLKFTLFTTVWLWLKPRWRGLLALAVFVLMVNILHSEYLDYVELSGEKQHLVWSFAIKWALIILGLAVYALATSLMGKPAATSKKKAGKKVPDSKAATGDDGTKPAGDDGFDFLRKKKVLETRADKLISGKK